MPRNLLTKLETWIVVTVITVLIWLYAEGAIQQTYRNEPINVRFAAPPNTPLAIEPELARPLVTFRGSGPQHQVFKNRTGRAPIELIIQPDGDNPQQRIDLAERLNQALFNELGLAVDDVDPPFEELTVRRLVRRTVPITVIDRGVDLKGPAAVEPPTLSVQLPEDLADLLAQQGVTVRLDEAVANNEPPPNELTQLTLPVVLPQAVLGRWTTPELREVEVSFTVAKVQDTLTLPSVPLAIVTPPGFPFDVVPQNDEKVIRDVQLTGPSDVLERIRANPQLVVAELTFLDGVTDLTAGLRVETVTFRVPAGVQPVGLPQLTVELVPRRPNGNGVNGNTTP